MIRFECQQTGRCCVSHGSYGYVFLTESDLVRLEEYLGIKRVHFAQKGLFKETSFSAEEKEHWFFKNSEKQCQFLKGKACGIYEARPNQCRAWPFWTSNLEAKNWTYLKTFCPGIGKGKDWSREEIDAIIATTKELEK